MTERVERRLLAILVSAWICGCVPNPAGPPPESGRSSAPGLIPLEAFFSTPYRANPKLSPNGKQVAWIGEADGHRNVIQLDLETGESELVTCYRKRKVYDFWWASDERLLVSVFFRGGMTRSLIASDIGCRNILDFSRERGGAAGAKLPRALGQQYADVIVDLLPDDPDHVLIAYAYFPERRRVAFKVHRLNVYSGKTRVVASSRTHPLYWWTDGKGVVRLGYGLRRGLAHFVYRVGEHSDWIDAAPEESERLDELAFWPLGFAEDPRLIYVASRHEGDRFGVYLYDVVGKEFVRPLFQHERYDVDGPLLFSQPSPAAARRLVGIGYLGDRGEVHWTDEEWKNLMRRIEAALPGMGIRLISASRDESRLLLHASNGHDPGQYCLMLRETNEIKLLASPLPDLDSSLLAPVRSVSYRARDGLPIQAHLTLPLGGERDPIPIIVRPHGGPWARDIGEFDAEVQFLASRGWGVFQPNFRGSTGFGLDFQMKGYREWGLAMQDDISDGVQWLIEQGIADPARICIYGASYGGYAALAGLTRTPELYACGATLAGISDLRELLWDRQWFINQDVMEKRLGRRWRDRERLEETSPLKHIDAIRAPVFIAHGDRDRIVDSDQSEMLATALRKAGKPYELFIMEDEGHGIFHEANRLEYYRRLEAFFAHHLGWPAPRPATP